MRASSEKECTWLKFSKFHPFDAIPQISFPKYISAGELQFSRAWGASPRQSSSVEGEAMKHVLTSVQPEDRLESRSQPNDTSQNHKRPEILD